MICSGCGFPEDIHGCSTFCHAPAHQRLPYLKRLADEATDPETFTLRRQSVRAELNADGVNTIVALVRYLDQVSAAARALTNCVDGALFMYVDRGEEANRLADELRALLPARGGKGSE